MNLDGGVRNELSQSVIGTVVQAGAIHGGVHVHHTVVPKVVPRQLPSAPRFFTDRASELALLDEGLVTPSEDSDRGGPVVVALTGSGGVGKTALALRWLHGQVARFPDGQLYADLSAFGEAGPAEPASVLGGFLRALGLPGEVIPPDLAERIALFRSVTAGRSMALLLDDAASLDQTRALLPTSAACVVIVTSRWRLGGLTLLDARMVSVEPLGTAAAVLLLDKAVGQGRVAQEPDAAENVASLCGGVPLALRVAAARLATRPRWRLAGLADELADLTRRLTTLVVDEGTRSAVSVAASFDLSYRMLAPEAARVYRLLALHPGTEFSGGVASAAIGAPRPRTEELLDILVRANLVVDVADDRYRFHDLLRVHAQRLAEAHDPDTVRQAAVEAMVSWYLDFAVAADATVTPLRWHLGDRYQRREPAVAKQATPPNLFHAAAQALDALEYELVNLMAAVTAAERHGWDELVWQLGEALWGVFLYRGHYPEWITICDRAARAAARCGNIVAESRMLVQLAAAHLRLNQPETAEIWSQQAWRRARDVEDWRSEATALESLGSAAHAQGRLGEAIDYYRQSLALNERHGLVRGATLLLGYLGYALRDSGDNTGAVDSFRRSADLATTIGDHHSHAQALVGIGTVYARRGDFTRAITQMTQALTMLSDTEAPALRVPVLEQLAELSYQAGDLHAARQYWNQALELYHRAGDPKAERVRAKLQKLDLPEPTL